MTDHFVTVGDDLALPPAVKVLPGHLPAAGVPAAMVGLDRVNNTNDLEKPVSTLVQQALNGKVGLAVDETITGSKTFNSQKGTRFSTYVGFGAGVGSARNPFYLNTIVDGSAIQNTLAAGGGDDYVGLQNNVKFAGGFAALKTLATGSMTAGSNVLTLTSGTFTAPVTVGYTAYVPGAGVGGGLPVKSKITSITDPTHAVLAANAATTVTNVQVILTLASDHNFAFMANDFYTTGTAAGDLSGIDNLFGRLTELHLYTPNATLNAVKAGSFELDIEASAAGSTVTTAAVQEISAIRNDGNVPITNAYGLWIHGKAPANATNAWGLVVDDGGKTKLTGAVTIAGTVAADTLLDLKAPLSPTGELVRGYDVTGTNRVFHIGTNGSIGSNSFLTAFEGLSTQVSVGQMPGGGAGLQLGVTGSSPVVLRRSAAATLAIDSADVDITDATKGLILKSPGGTRYRLTVGDDGALTTTAL